MPQAPTTLSFDSKEVKIARLVHPPGAWGYFDDDDQNYEAFETKEPQSNSTSVSENTFPATGSILFNKSSIINEGPVSPSALEGPWFTITGEKVAQKATKVLGMVGEVAQESVKAGYELVTNEVFGMVTTTPKTENSQNLNPEAARKQQNESLAYKQALRVIQEEKQRYLVQAQEEAVQEALRILERPIAKADITNIGLNYADIGKVTDPHHLTQMRTWQAEQANRAKQAETAQSIIPASRRRAGPILDQNKIGEGASLLSVNSGGVG